MSSVLGFDAVSILNTQDFSWVFLVDWIMILTLIIYVLFYVNQLMGWLVTQLVGWYVHHRYNVYFKVEAVKLSLLGSRLTFKNLVYVGPNESVRIVHGHLTWQYWLPARRRAAYLIKSEAQKSRPCALALNIMGIEWFIYNRSPAYDALQSHDPVLEMTNIISKELSHFEAKLVALVPLKIKVSQHALVLGNDRTPNLLVFHSSRAIGELDIDVASNAYDRYMIKYMCRHENLSIKLEPNPDWTGSFVDKFPKNKRLSKMPKRIEKLLMKSKSRKLDEKGVWLGLERYALEDEQTSNKYDGEYARVPTMYESEWTEIDFGFDMVGPHEEEADSKSYNSDVIPPDFYIDIRMSDATITYGPWHDRQRILLQKEFTPQRCTDSKLPPSAVAGTARSYQSMRVNFETVDQALLVVPTREESKDNVAPNRQLNYGWLELRIGPGSAGRYEMPYFPHSNGFLTTLSLDLKRPELRSSVNHATVLVGSSHQLTCKQQAPLQWNGKQEWTITQETKDMDMYLLREHISLISDTIVDFSSGEKVEYSLFCPAVYKYNWTITNWALYLNVNKLNVINNPTSLNENIFLVFRTAKTSIDSYIPVDEISPEVHWVNFALRTPKLTMELSAPQWHTLQSFLDVPQLGVADDFEIKFDDYFSIARIQRAIDQRIMHIGAKEFTLLCYGFVLDYLMTIRENYFGQSYHFKTTEEFFEEQENQKAEKYSFSRPSEPDTDITVTASVYQCCFVLPANLYSARHHLALYYDELNVDCRFTNYYMDIQANFSPVTLQAGSAVTADEVLTLASHPPSNSGSYIDNINIHGHRMFGLPPSEPTYMCKWDFDVGKICVDDLTAVVMVPRIVSCFSHGYNDEENKPVLVLPELHDVTFVSAHVKSLHLLLEGISVDFSAIRFRFNDLANERYSARIYFETEVLIRARKDDGTVTGEFQFPLCVSNFTTLPDPVEKYELQQAHIALHDSLFHRCPFLLQENFRNSKTYRSAQKWQDSIHPNIPLPNLPPQLTPEVWSIFHPNLADFELNSHHSSSRGSSVRSHFEPSESSSSSEEFHDSQSTHDGGPLFDLGPTQWYAGAPTLTGSDGDLNEDFVIQFGDIRGQISIGIEECIKNVILKWPSESIESLLDGLQIELVKKLKPERSPTVLRAHVILPLFYLKLTEKWDSSDFISVVLRDVDAIGQLAEGDLQGLHFDFRGLSITLRQGKKESPAAVVSLSNLTSWLINDKKGERYGAVKCADLDFMVSGEEIDWILDFGDRLATDVSQAWSKLSLPQTQSNPLGSAFLLLAKTGEENLVEEDSYVLSRPSGTIQSSEHVRSNISWRVMVRERYLLQTLDEAAVSNIRTQTSNGHYKLPEDSREQAIEVFKRWRSWEHDTNLEYATIFDLVYPKNEENPKIIRAESMLVAFESMSIRLILEQAEHFARTDDLSVQLSSRHESDASSVNLLLCCSQVTTEMGYDILPFLNVVADGDIWKRIPTKLQSDSRMGQPGTRPPDALQLNATIMVYDVSFFFKLPSLMVESQSSKFQSIITSEYMQTGDFRTTFYSGIVVCETSGFRIYRPSEEIADGLIKSLAIGVALKSRNVPWVTISSENMSVEVHIPTLRPAEIISEFVTQDISLFERFLNPDSPQKTHNQAPQNSSEPTLGAGISFNINSMRIRTLLLDDIEILLQGQGLAIRALTGSPIVSMDFEKGALTAYYGKVLVAGMHLEETRMLTRSQGNVSECFASTYRIRMETASLVWLMSFVQQPELKGRLLAVQDKVAEIFKSPTKPADRSASKPIHAQVFINTVQLQLPIGSRTVVIALDDIDLHHAASGAISSGLSMKFNIFLVFAGLTQMTRQLLKLQLEAKFGRGPDDGMVDIRSKRCELAFDPETVGALNMAFRKVKGFRPTGSEGKADSIKEFDWKGLENIKAAVELQQLSFTWYTDSTSTEGLQVGIERISLTSFGLVMRLELSGIYLTPVAPGSKIPVDKRANTAYLPQLEASSAFIKEKKFLNLHMKGTRLKVDMTAGVAPWLAKIIRSMEITKGILARLGPSTPESTPKEEVNTSIPENQKPRRHQLSINLHASVKFAGAVLRLFDDANEVHEKEHPALELHTPSVELTSDFMRQESSRDQIFVNIVVSSTSNTIFPKALQECRTMYDNIRIILERDAMYLQEEKTRQSEAVVGSLLRLPGAAENASNAVNYNFLDKAELSIRLHFGSQEIYLSCVPFAKVGTLIASQPSELFITSEDDTLTAQAIIKGAQVSLQHVYSREISWQTRFDQASAAIHKTPKKPFRILTNIHSPQLKMNLIQLHDLHMFLDIWRFFDLAVQTQDHEESEEEGKEEETNAGDWLSRAAKSTFQAFTVNLNAVNMKMHVIFGQSIGEAHVTVGRAWAAGFQSSDGQKLMNCGMNSVKLESEGRVGGSLKVSDSFIRLAKLSTGQAQIIQAVSGVKALECYFCLDFHPFLALKVGNAEVGLMNQYHSLEKLLLAINVERIQVVATALVASHMSDVVKLFRRLHAHVSTSSNLYSPEVRRMHSEIDKTDSENQNRLSSVDLRVELDAKVGDLLIHIFPAEFTDTMALRVHGRGLALHFSQMPHKSVTLDSVIDIHMISLTIGLSQMRTKYAATMTSLDTSQFLEFVRCSSPAGTVLLMPMLHLNMKTSESEREVHFIFANEFGGSVEVGWNLGSINFIKEIIRAHRSSWLSRQQLNTTSVSPTVKSPKIPLPEKIYVADRKLEVINPQLRDLGEATPPIEWLGMNRERLPRMMHKYVIVALNDISKEAKLLYTELHT